VIPGDTGSTEAATGAGKGAMTREERFDQLLRALELGPVFPLWGIVDGPDGKPRCECGEEGCKCPGKHPRNPRRKLARQATYDVKKIKRWLYKWPNINFAVRTGEKTIVVDKDVKEGKDGLASISNLEAASGQTIPTTVTVLSGRDNGSEHSYFWKPEGFTLSARTEFIPGVDMKGPNQYVVAPGSRHIAGGFYRFAPERDPAHQPLAEVPALLLEKILTVADKTHVAGVRKAHNASNDPCRYDVLPPCGELRPDAVVRGALRHDRLGGPLHRGKKLYTNLSTNDFILAMKLAFYTCHNFEQALRLFRESGQKREKYSKMVNKKYCYAEWQIRKAFCLFPANWIPKPRKRPSRATGAKRGRKPTEITVAVLELHQQHPEWSPKRLGDELSIPSGRVRKILHNLNHGMYADWSVTHCVTLIDKKDRESNLKWTPLEPDSQMRSTTVGPTDEKRSWSCPEDSWHQIGEEEVQQLVEQSLVASSRGNNGLPHPVPTETKYRWRSPDASHL
jgi:hypothetical protein